MSNATNTVSVYLWNTLVGTLHLEDGKRWAAFEYDRDFMGIFFGGIAGESFCCSCYN